MNKTQECPESGNNSQKYTSNIVCIYVIYIANRNLDYDVVFVVGRDRDDRQGRGDFKNDRFSRGGGQSDRYRDRRPPPPSSIDRFDRRGGATMNDRNPAAPSYDRG